MPCSSCQSASGRSNTCSLLLQDAIPAPAGAWLHSISGEEIRPTMKVDDRAHRATIRTAATARGMRCRSRKLAAGDSMVPTTKAVTTGRKKALATIENGDDADDEQRDQREGDHLGAPDHRRQFVSAVGQRRTGRFAGRRTLVGKDTQLALPAAGG